MKRVDSQELRERYERAQKKGIIVECLGNKCVCWQFCSQGGKRKVPGCDADLSTGFYLDIAKEEITTVSYSETHFDLSRPKKKRKARDKS